MISDNNITFELVKPHTTHAELIMAWRNDPGTLAMSFHRAPKVWPHFFEEVAKTYFQYPALPPLFACHKGKRVAFLRFRPLPHPRVFLRKCCDISINVAPDYRGKGLAVDILTEVQPVLRACGIEDVLAEIRQENTASCHVFEKAGFRFLEDTEKFIPDTGETCSIRRYMASLVSANPKTGGVFVIAEAGSNWRMGTPDRDREMARTLIDVAVQAGADAVKFQTYRPETVYVENAGRSDYLAEHGIQTPIRDIFADLAMPYDLLSELSAYCQEQGILFMSTPFSSSDFEAVDPHVRLHKIASYEISHLRLLEGAARSGKPLILSTGASREEDIQWAVETFYAHGGRELCLLQCTTKYPAPLNAMNLAVLPWLKQRFGTAVGLSDHSRHPTYAPLAAVALGASVIEKHFTLDNRLPGPDHAFAILPEELKDMVDAIRAGEQMLGSGVKEILPVETELHNYARRGIQALCPIEAGEVLQEGENVDILRPGQQRLGLHPRHLLQLAGKTATRPIPAGDGLQPGDWQ